MKTKLFFMAVMLCASSHVFAQQSDQGFYINPFLSFGNQSRQFLNRPNMLQPQLSLGHIWGNKNRHNLSVSGISGGLGKYYSNIGLELRYSYDWQLIQHKRFSFYLSPYAKVGGSYFRSNDVSHSGFNSKYGNNFMFVGIAPSIEYKISRNTKFVFSLPINVFGMSHSQGSYMNNGTRNNFQYNDQRFLPSAEANIGIRIGLGSFRK